VPDTLGSDFGAVLSGKMSLETYQQNVLERTAVICSKQSRQVSNFQYYPLALSFNRFTVDACPDTSRSDRSRFATSAADLAAKA
jgi:hypothetical protein